MLRSFAKDRSLASTARPETRPRAFAPQDVDTSVPAIVLQLKANPLPYGALGAIRSLGRLGVRVISARSPAATRLHSRYVAEAVVVRGEGTELTEALIALTARLGNVQPVLICTDDVGALYLDRHREALSAHLRLPAQPTGLARKLSDKAALAAMCEEYGIPTPRTVTPRDSAELERALASFQFPIVVKSADPEILARTPNQTSVSIVNDVDALRALFPPPPWQTSNLLLQDYVPGDPTTVWMFNGYMGNEGGLLAGFTGQKIRQHPLDSGCTALGICRPNAEVYALAARLLRSVGYRGIVDMGFRYDARDGSYRLLDVNPRLGATFRLFVGDDDLDVVRALYLDLTGHPASAAAGRDGRRWLVEPLDAASSLRLWRRGQLPLSTWRESLRGVEELAWYAGDDPLPAAEMAVGVIGRIANARVHRPRATSRTEPELIEPLPLGS